MTLWVKILVKVSGVLEAHFILMRHDHIFHYLRSQDPVQHQNPENQWAIHVIFFPEFEISNLKTEFKWNKNSMAIYTLESFGSDNRINAGMNPPNQSLYWTELALQTVVIEQWTAVSHQSNIAVIEDSSCLPISSKPPSTELFRRLFWRLLCRDHSWRVAMST